MTAIVSIKIGDGSSIVPEDWFVLCGKYSTGVNTTGTIKMYRAAAWTGIPPGSALAFYGGSGNILAQISNAAILSLPTYNPNDDDTIVDTGIALSEPAVQYGFVDGSCGYVPPAPSCDDDSDCPDGEKCVDGECIPCDVITDLSGSASLMGLDSLNQFVADKTSHTFVNSTPITKSVGDFQHISTLRITNSNGFPAGAVSVVANYQHVLLMTNSSESLGSVTFSEGQADSSLQINRPKVSTYGWSMISLTITPLFADAGKCNEGVVEPPDDQDIIDVFPPPQEPIVPPPPEGPEPPQPEKPDEYEPPIPPTPPTPPAPPTPPTPPTPPSTGCECEIYIAQSISTSITVLSQTISTSIAVLVQSIGLLKDTISPLMNAGLALLSAIISKLFDWFFDKTAWLGEWFQKFLDFGYYFGSYLKEFYEAQQVLNRAKADDLIESVDSITDELKTFNKKFAEFADNYEPVQIENEYRTQSHRIIDNLDSTLNKL